MTPAQKTEKLNKEKYDSSDPNLDIILDISKISKVIAHLNKHMKLTRDVGAKARLGTSISNLSKTKNILVCQVIELEKLVDGLKKKDKIDHRYN